MRFLATSASKSNLLSPLLLSTITARYLSIKTARNTICKEQQSSCTTFQLPRCKESKPKRKRRVAPPAITDVTKMLNNKNDSNNNSSSSSNSNSSSTWHNIDDDGIAKYIAHREVYRNDTLSILVDGFRFARPYKRYLLKSRTSNNNTAYKKHTESNADNTKSLSSYFANVLPSSHNNTTTKTNNNNDNSLATSAAATTTTTTVNTSARRASAEYTMKEIDNVKVFYLLSHFHGDHYTGLNSSWKSGIIYCSKGTAALTAYKLHVHPSYLFPMEFGVTYLFSLSSGQCITKWASVESIKTIEDDSVTGTNETNLSKRNDNSNNNSNNDSNIDGDEAMCDEGTFTVHLVPANHCPGAALFVLTSPAFGRIVHTGDLRFNGSLASWIAHASRYGGWLPAKISHIISDNSTCCVSEEEVQINQNEKHTQTSKLTSPSTIPAPFYEQFMQDNPALQRVASRVDKLFLDNTFCDPNYRFPRQWQINQEVITTLYSLLTRSLNISTPLPKECRHSHASEAFVENNKTTYKWGSGSKCEKSQERCNAHAKSIHCAVLVGTYTIGKERVALAIQDAFRSVNKTTNCNLHCNVTEANSTLDLIPIYTHPEKYELLRRLEYHTNHFTPVEPYNRQAVQSSFLSSGRSTVHDGKETKRHTLREALERSKTLHTSTLPTMSSQTISETVHLQQTKMENEAGLSQSIEEKESSLWKPTQQESLKRSDNMHSIFVCKHEVCLPHWSLQQDNNNNNNNNNNENQRCENVCNNTNIDTKANLTNKTKITIEASAQRTKKNSNKKNLQEYEEGLVKEENEKDQGEDVHYYLSIYLLPLHMLNMSNLRAATGWHYKRGRYNIESKTWLTENVNNNSSSASSSDCDENDYDVSDYKENNLKDNSKKVHSPNDGIYRKHDTFNSYNRSKKVGATTTTTTTTTTTATVVEPPLLIIGPNYGLDLSLFDRVLAVEPSGWVRMSRCENITDWCTLLHVPYSEHCSFDEMLNFTEFVNPLKVIPTVSEANFRKREALFVERAPRMKNGTKTTIPITRFFNKVVTSTLSMFTHHEENTPKVKQEIEFREAVCSSATGVSCSETRGDVVTSKLVSHTKNIKQEIEKANTIDHRDNSTNNNNNNNNKKMKKTRNETSLSDLSCTCKSEDAKCEEVYDISSDNSSECAIDNSEGNCSTSSKANVKFNENDNDDDDDSADESKEEGTVGQIEYYLVDV